MPAEQAPAKGTLLSGDALERRIITMKAQAAQVAQFESAKTKVIRKTKRNIQTKIKASIKGGAVG
jgi:hypothetical protein